MISPDLENATQITSAVCALIFRFGFEGKMALQSTNEAVSKNAVFITPGAPSSGAGAAN
jgi:hypothetical protein